MKTFSGNYSADSADDHRYDDLLNLPHPVSANHPPMPRLDRAAQFAPFAALTGYEGCIREEARLTDKRIELDENAKTMLDAKLRILEERSAARPEVSVTYFQPDARKAGGTYVTVTASFCKLDRYTCSLFLAGSPSIRIEDVVEISGEAVDFIEQDFS